MSTEFQFIVRQKYKNAYSITKHTHPCHELVYYIYGAGTSTVNDQSYTFGKQTALLTAPNEIHGETSDQLVEVLFIGFSTDHEFDCSFFNDENGEIYQIMLEAERELKNKKPFYTQMLNALSDKLVYTLLRNSPQKKYRHSDFKAVLDYIDANATKNISIKQMATDIGYCYDYLRQLFIQNTRMTAKQYLMQVKLNKVKDYLINSDLRLDFIAEITGFTSPSHLCMSFRKAFGMSPMEYKATNVNNDRIDNHKKEITG